MGWIKQRGLLWGDEPADVMDRVLAQKFGRNWYDKKIPLDKVKRGVRAIVANNTLRARIDRIYKKEWGRKATNAEYRNLIWGLPKHR